MRKIDTQNFRRATRDTSREFNRLIILNLIRERGPISRAEIARIMGVPRGMVTSLVTELIDKELVVEGKTQTAPRGRRPTLLHLRSSNRLTLGIDIGVRRTDLLLADFAGQAVARDSFPTIAERDRMAAELTRRIEKITADREEPCEGVGVVVPGMVNEADGTVLHVPGLKWIDFDLGDRLSSSLKIPVYIERDAVSCAAARMWLGTESDETPSNFAYVLVSDGVGIGLIFEGQPVRGAHRGAGEYGHLPLNLDGPECSCGARGCLEAYASDRATLNRYAMSANGAGDVTMQELVRLCESNADARAAVEDTGRYLGAGLSALINSFNPERIVVGGDIVGAWDIVEPLLRSAMMERALLEAVGNTTLEADPHHAETRLRGAASLVVAEAFSAPVVG